MLHTWERDAENVQPYFAGRPNPVSSAISVTYEQALRQFEFSLRGSQDDPLQCWVTYIATLRNQVFPGGHELIEKTIQECATMFQADERYKNDPRFLNIWLELAKKRADPRDVFEFMQQKGICLDLPKFYVAIASVAEQRNDYWVADDSYKRAVRTAQARMQNLPQNSTSWYIASKEFNWVNKLLDHFKRRLARKAINSSTQHNRAMHGVSPPSHGKPSSLQSRPFAIFQGTTASAVPQASAPWKTVPMAISSENAGPAKPWAGSGGLSYSSSSKPAVLPSHPTGFKVWTEDVEEEGNEFYQEKDSKKVAKDPFNVWNGKNHLKNAEKKQAESSVSQSSAGLTTRFADMNLNDVVEVKPRPQLITSSNPSVPPIEQDVTINTRMAIDDMFDVFASPSMSSVKPPPIKTTTNRRPKTTTVTTTSRHLDPPARLIFTPAPLIAMEHENHSPNASLLPTISVRRPTQQNSVRSRPALGVLEHRDADVSPSFRSLLSNPPAPITKENFSIFADDEPTTATTVTATTTRSFFSRSRTNEDDATFEGTLLGLTETLDGIPSNNVCTATTSKKKSALKPNFDLFMEE